MNKQEQLDSEKSDLYKLRHTAEHILHQAVKELYPDIQLAMGPATDEGFYFDFDNKPEGKAEIQISELDFPKIEKRMKKIVERNLPVTRHEISVTEARELFKDNPYKLEWVAQIEAKGEIVTIYWTGKPGEAGAMVDLCAGPHLDSTGKVKHFKLLSVAGAYWRGSEKNKMLTRIYGTAFFTAEELDAFVKMKQEAKDRDHRKLGKELDLFTFSDLVGPGLPLWTPRGTLMRNILNDFVWELRKARGYDRVEIPHITKKDLYVVSGHWDKFGEELFSMKTREGHHFVMKPMNCPHHTQIFARKPHSYKEMPQRYANTTMVYRDEQTGELSGLSRVRAITQDDAHVFCRLSQFKEEVLKIWDIVDEFYKAVGFKLTVRLSLSDHKKPENYMGIKADWDMAENALREIAKERGVVAVEALGEAAFYGPKLDFMANDSLGREWQVATIQLDMNMPKSFDLSCTNEKGEKEQIVMLHAAIMGSIERYMSILIEHFAGKFPTWLAPVQAKVLPVSDKYIDFAKKVVFQLAEAGVRVELDDRAERLQAKIRDAQMDKVPYMLVVGEKEASDNTVAVRKLDTREQNVISVAEFSTKILKEINEKSL
ncbi:MAG: threonine--tRNA ligase [Candidatus Pacebacteria bacterium CG_4_10_14_3_um_filter_34_15]|nr:MAG: threonine--tRNA ligase [Candidatus Pacebacteria bacterium CG_4_10_14_3_um_filter_34_15]